MQLNAIDTVKCHLFLQLSLRTFIISFTFLERDLISVTLHLYLKSSNL